MKNEIKKAWPMVWVEIAYWPNNIERLYYEGTMAEFYEKIKKAQMLFFPLYEKVVDVSKIKEFWNVKDEKIKSKEQILKNLTEEQREKVKFFEKNFKSNIWRVPNTNEFQNMVQKAIYWEKKENTEKINLTNEQKEQRKEFISEMKRKLFEKGLISKI